MEGSGGMGTLNPPDDGDEIAQVTPLGRRDPHLVAVPTVRDPLPAETSVWDTGELGEPPLRRSRGQRLKGLLTTSWSAFRSRAALLGSRPVLIVGLVVACVTVVAAIAFGSRSGSIGRGPQTALSSLSPHASSGAKLSGPTADHPAHHATQGKARRHIRATSRRGAKRASTRRVGRGDNSKRTPAIAKTAIVQTSIPPTALRTANNSSSTALTSSEPSEPSHPAGPTGSGAAFGPGY
jgi:hypothetical protein